VAQFVPELVDPTNPDSIAEWARLITALVSGQISIGEPIAPSPDPATPTALDALRPNGVKGHMLGSFVQVSIGTGDLDVAFTCTHNLNIPNKVAGGLNVGWVIVRAEHNGTGAGVTSSISVNYETGDTVTANAIDLRFYANARTVNDANPIVFTLWFFPATR
jgi:hypothetical protein